MRGGRGIFRSSRAPGGTRKTRGTAQQPAGVSVWALKSYTRGGEDSRKLESFVEGQSHHSRGNSCLWPAFQRMQEKWEKPTRSLSESYIDVLGRLKVRDQGPPSGPGLIVARVYTDQHHRRVLRSRTGAGVTCMSAYWEPAAACIRMRVYSLQNHPILLFGKTVIRYTCYRWKTHW